MAGSAKAVADGAAAWYIRRSVTFRVTRFAYGVIGHRPCDRSDQRHRSRTVHNDCDGDNVHGVWSEIVAKVRFYNNGANAIIDRRGRIALLHLMICGVNTIITYTLHQTHL
jgi:hypothetical protein